MTGAPTYDEVVSGADSEIATFQLGGWVGAVVTKDGHVWAAIRKPGGEEVVGEAADVRTAVRHYTSALHQAATRSTSNVLVSPPGSRG